MEVRFPRHAAQRHRRGAPRRKGRYARRCGILGVHRLHTRDGNERGIRAARRQLARNRKADCRLRERQVRRRSPFRFRQGGGCRDEHSGAVPPREGMLWRVSRPPRRENAFRRSVRGALLRRRGTGRQGARRNQHRRDERIPPFSVRDGAHRRGFPGRVRGRQAFRVRDSRRGRGQDGTVCRRNPFRQRNTVGRGKIFAPPRRHAL